MNTPIYDFLKEYIASDFSRLHMPGHKGASTAPELSAMFPFDITEIKGADSLFEAEDIIAESEENASSLYETKATCFSAGGSTLCIQTMISLVCKPKSKIIASRNAHKAFVNTCALLDLTPCFIKPCYNDSFGVSGEVSPESVEEAIKANPDASAVYITSPDYLGVISDVKAIAEICRAHNLPLLVDNAHGAHLKFTKEDLHPITMGATLCCDSPHKTLPVLTGGAYLHISPDCNITKEEAKARMALFGSTSPSYLIMLSLDLNNKYLAEKARMDFSILEDRVNALYSLGLPKISSRNDITKLTIDCYKLGYDGGELAELLRKAKIECEYSAKRHVVLMLSPFNREIDFERIENFLKNLKRRAPIEEENLTVKIPKPALSIREAIFKNSVNVSVENALGRISAETKIKCPPGVPVIVAGEIIDEDAQKILKMSSISSINVIQ